MPEGTTDVHVGLIAALVPRSEGRSEMRAVVLPTLSAQFSNGVFASPGEVGMQLSETPMLRYGPILHYGTKTQRADSSEDRRGLQLEPGAFVAYNLAYNIHLHANLLYGGGAEGNGLRLNTGIGYSMRLSAHQSASLGTGAVFGNSSYLDSYFGTAAYHPGGGLKSTYVSANWHAELSTKYSVSAGIRGNQLAKLAADSPLVNARRTTVLLASISYKF